MHLLKLILLLFRSLSRQYNAFPLQQAFSHDHVLNAFIYLIFIIFFKLSFNSHYSHCFNCHCFYFTNRYIHEPAKDHYEHGHKRGSEHHFIERHEKAHPHAGEFKTKVINI